MSRRNLVLDLRRATLALREPGLRVVDADTGEHVASVLPDERGYYHDHAEAERLAIIEQSQVVADRELPYARKPCDECPWRRDVATGRFTPERFIALAPCAHDMARTIFACHKSPEGREFACAGFLLQASIHNLTVRLARQAFDVQSPFPLFKSYRDMAHANGVPKGHPGLRHCREDAQRKPSNG